MEAPKAFSSTFQLRPRPDADVPEDVEELMMDHLGDPYMDLKDLRKRYASKSDAELSMKKDEYESQYESDRYSTSRAESRYSTTLDFDDDSPYPEVRAAVGTTDDPTMPVNTLRMWIIGIFFSILCSGINQMLALRYPSLYITGIVVQLIALPVGKFFERVLPAWQFTVAGYTMSLNPGPFNIKEHTCITVMANVAVTGSYATDIFASQKIFYGENPSLAFQYLLDIGTQVLGFSFGGILRQFVVWPASMVWPSALVNAALLNTLHKSYGVKEGNHMSRERFFLYVFLGSFAYYWLPGYLFTALSVFNWVCWIKPESPTINALFGTTTGLGMGILTFDWSMISYISSPLVTPFWSQLNTFTGMVIIFWIIAPIIYFTNTFDTAFMPINDYYSYDREGLPYDASAIVTNGWFDEEKYQAYSPLFIPTTLLLQYGLIFAALTATGVHSFLWFRKDIARRFKLSLKDERDVHSRLMQVYPEVSHLWYLVVGLISLVFTLVAIEIHPTQLPIWGALVAVVIALALVVPLAMIQAVTNQLIPFQVLHELIAGYALPGRPIANSIFKTIAFTGTSSALMFASDLKLGHYMKVPPRMMFTTQCVAVLIACVVTTSVNAWMMDNVEGICSPDQPNGFVCPGTTIFSTATVIWGGIGPQRMFSPGSRYAPLCWFFLVGAVLPIPFYMLARRYPLSWYRYVNIPIFFAGLSAIPPASGSNYATWMLVGFIFNYLIRRSHERWWTRYNYILSAGLDAGVALALVAMFLFVALPTSGKDLEWWGNTVWQKTGDAMGMPLKMLTDEQPTFGPETW